MASIEEKIAKLEEQKAEIKRKEKELNAKIRAVRSKELHKQRKLETHYKVLLGAYLAHSVADKGEIPQVTIEGLKKFINDDKKHAEVIEFLKGQIEKAKG